ncbi:Lrp/AsnC family transcriptional regulator [Aminomonas paucivorans]|uniref:Transcriptional regulator, AsnC family n=2 Tax=Aminomonas TaxID=81411 RepID=E3D138_9BACT|nr:transcriptional regulator, AsnC family [Aminomonas paucivorans DSM 12260]
MDILDFKILHLLLEDGRLSWTELGKSVGLTPPGVADRVRRLGEKGPLLGFSARVDEESMGYAVLAFVGVTLQRPQHRKPFLEAIASWREVQECHHLAGEEDYLLKVRTFDLKSLDRLISDRIKGLRGVLRTRTQVVLSTEKESPLLPLREERSEGVGP